MHGGPAGIGGACSSNRRVASHREQLAPPLRRRRRRARPHRPAPKKTHQNLPKKTIKISQDAFAPGPGTYERAGSIYASLVGSLVRHDDQGAAAGKANKPSGSDSDDDDEDKGRRRAAKKPVLAVTSARALLLAPQRPAQEEDAQQQSPSSSALVVPRPGDVVTGRVTRVGPATAQVALLCAGAEGRALPTFPGAAPFPGSGPTAGAFRGVVRKQDVRRTDVDGVVMADCFRPGDVVRCAVLSLGDSRAYFLSTAANELGVVAARSAASGKGMVAVSWQEMACPLTGAVERRKVARVVAAAKKAS